MSEQEIKKEADGEESANKWEKMSQEHEAVSLQELNRAAEIAEAESEVADPISLQEQLRNALEQVSKCQDENLRVRAELNTIIRRSQEREVKALKFANEDFIKALFPIMDSLERGLVACPEPASPELENLQQGMVLTLKMFSDLLHKFGVQLIDPIGEKFNPAEHEAMKLEKQADVEPNQVLLVFQKGYKLHDRVVRPAMVVVSA